VATKRKKTKPSRTNAERQRRYIAKLKERADAPHSPDVILDALARLRPIHFLKGEAARFAARLRAEAERLAPGLRDEDESRSPVSNISR
jgi:hypothetical protein